MLLWCDCFFIGGHLCASIQLDVFLFTLFSPLQIFSLCLRSAAFSSARLLLFASIPVPAVSQLSFPLFLNHVSCVARLLVVAGFIVLSVYDGCIVCRSMYERRYVCCTSSRGELLRGCNVCESERWSNGI